MEVPEVAHHPVFTEECLEQALGDGAVRRPQDRGQIHRMLRPGALEWGLTRAPWWSPYALYLPIVLAAIGWRFGGSWQGLAVAPQSIGLLVLGGIVWWSLFEYWLHRAIFHLPPRNDVLRVITFVIHRHHHVDPDVTQRLVATPLQSGSVLVPFALMACAAAPTSDAWIWFGVGSVTGYLIYEWVHYSAHHREPRTALGRRFRAHHLRHHFKDSTTNFGISSPLWDVVFRTRAN